MTPEVRRARQNARNARLLAARSTVRSETLTYLANPADSVYTVHRSDCYVLRGRGSNIAGPAHWKARLNVCRQCKPDPAAAAALPVARQQPPVNAKAFTALAAMNEANARRSIERRVRKQWEWLPARYMIVVVPLDQAVMNPLAVSPSAEDVYFAALAEEDEPAPSCGWCNRPQTGQEWAAGTCRACGGALDWPRRTTHEPLSREELCA